MAPRARREDAFGLRSAPVGGPAKEALSDEMMFGCVAPPSDGGTSVGVSRSVKQAATDCAMLGHGGDG